MKIYILIDGRIRMEHACIHTYINTYIQTYTCLQMVGFVWKTAPTPWPQKLRTDENP